MGRWRFRAFHGKYRVHLGGEKGVVAKALSIGDTLLNDTAIEVGADGVKDLKITGEKGSGSVRGFMYRDGRPAAGVLVVLAQATPSLDHIRYRGFITDSDGSFDWK